VALQVLYEYDLTGHDPQEILAERIEEEPLEENLADFSRQIVQGVVPIPPH